MSLRKAMLSLLCGALLALTLPRPGVCLLAWIAIMPFLYLLIEPVAHRSNGGKIRKAAILGFLFGVGFYGATTHWIYATCRFAGTPSFVGILAWAALTAVLSLNWILFAPLAQAVLGSFSPAAAPWVCAILWTGIEFAMERWTAGVGILPLEYTQWKYLSWIQAASWAGPHGLGFLILLWNAALACALSDLVGWGRVSKSTMGNLSLAGVLALGWWGYGAQILSGPRARGGSLVKGGHAESRIAILQPNVDQYQKWDEHYADRIRANFDELLGQAQAGRPALIVWPESSLPGWLDEPGNMSWITNWARRSKTHLFLGVLTRSVQGEFNSVVLIDPMGRIAGHYHKRRLVPFGEFVPIRPFLSRFIGILDQMAELTPGSAHQVLFQTAIGTIGATICFEAMFPKLNQDTAAAGAGVLINVTNDGWYEDTWGPYQHFYANIFRAVENRVPVVRAANTGISAVIDPYGRVVHRMNINQRGVLAGELPVNPFSERSFYSRRGDWFGWSALVAGVLTVFASLMTRKRT